MRSGTAGREAAFTIKRQWEESEEESGSRRSPEWAAQVQYSYCHVYNAASESGIFCPSLHCVWTRGTFSEHGYKVTVQDVKLSETTMAALRVWDGLPPPELIGKASGPGGESVSDSSGSQRPNVWDVLLDLGTRRKRGDKLGILCQVSFERLSSDLAFNSAE